MPMPSRILFIDDNEQILKLLQRYFEKRGYQVSTAINSVEALEQARDFPPAVVALDIWLGRDSGMDLLSTLKAQYPELPVIVMTGSGYDEELFQQARELGADGFVSKGLPLDHLVMEILRVSKYRNKALSPAE